MLAIEVVGRTATVPTFVFDEVDAGVGGRAAVDVGARLATLARHAQVVVVTHLAQVAAFADRHLVVRKSDDGVVTSSNVQRPRGRRAAPGALADDGWRRHLRGRSRARPRAARPGGGPARGTGSTPLRNDGGPQRSAWHHGRRCRRAECDHPGSRRALRPRSVSGSWPGRCCSPSSGSRAGRRSRGRSGRPASARCTRRSTRSRRCSSTSPPACPWPRSASRCWSGRSGTDGRETPPGSARRSSPGPSSSSARSRSWCGSPRSRWRPPSSARADAPARSRSARPWCGGSRRSRCCWAPGSSWPGTSGRTDVPPRRPRVRRSVHWSSSGPSWPSTGSRRTVTPPVCRTVTSPSSPVGPRWPPSCSRWSRRWCSGGSGRCPGRRSGFPLGWDAETRGVVTACALSLLGQLFAAVAAVVVTFRSGVGVLPVHAYVVGALLLSYAVLLLPVVAGSLRRLAGARGRHRFRSPRRRSRPIQPSLSNPC